VRDFVILIFDLPISKSFLDQSVVRRYSS